MFEKRQAVSVPAETIVSKIYLIRGHRVMIDPDLAQLYGVETKHLKRQVKRNLRDSRKILCLK